MGYWNLSGAPCPAKVMAQDGYGGIWPQLGVLVKLRIVTKDTRFIEVEPAFGGEIFLYVGALLNCIMQGNKRRIVFANIFGGPWKSVA